MCVCVCVCVYMCVLCGCVCTYVYICVAHLTPFSPMFFFYHLHWIFSKLFKFLLLKVLSLCNMEACVTVLHTSWSSDITISVCGRVKVAFEKQEGLCAFVCALHCTSSHFCFLSSCLCGFLGFLSVLKWACVSNTYIYRGTNRHSHVCWVSQTYWKLLFIWPGVAQVRCSSLGTSRHWPLDSLHKYL